MVKYALLAQVEAKPGKEREVEAFLRGALPLAQKEPGTRAWFAWKMSAKIFGIFDTFDDEVGRDAHLNGEIAKALMTNADTLLAKPPKIDKLEILAAK
ncbi:MAG: antibiotic biosynthesis monooxygenase [Rhodanobacteraceae bacterium]